MIEIILTLAGAVAGAVGAAYRLRDPGESVGGAVMRIMRGGGGPKPVR